VSHKDLQKSLEAIKARGGTAFVPYLTAGDPDLEATAQFVATLASAGAAVVELGVPFSDPLADGPVNQRAAARALASGTTLGRVIDLVATLRKRGVTVPIILFTYFNPVFVMGVERFADRAAEAGVSGVLAVDLPPEEAEEYREILGSRALATIFLASPTTDAARLRLIDEASSGFVYYVSRTGTTGVQADFSETLVAELKNVRTHVKKPFVVGFGIGEPEQARALARLADGIVIGSAIVRIIEAHVDPTEAARELDTFARAIVTAIDHEKKSASSGSAPPRLVGA
jgi:tryptophan synthase alpha chain